MAFSVGALVSSFVQGFFLTYIAEAIDPMWKDYVMLGMTAACGGVAAFIVTKSEDLVRTMKKLAGVLMGSFLFAGAFSGCLGGGNIGLLGLGQHVPLCASAHSLTWPANVQLREHSAPAIIAGNTSVWRLIPGLIFMLSGC